MRRILYDVSSEGVKKAEENIRNLSEAVEKELLSQVVVLCCALFS
jgi:hypothetical protein